MKRATYPPGLPDEASPEVRRARRLLAGYPGTWRARYGDEFIELPGAFASFPLAEVVWMAGSPIAIACLITGLVKIVRRAELPRGSCATS